MSDKVNPGQFGEQFGMSEQEQRQIEGRALGKHIFEGVEEAMFGYAGGMKDRVVNQGWESVESNWYAEHRAGHVTADPDDDDYPVYRHDLGDGYHATYPIDGVYATIHYGSGSRGGLDVVNFSADDDADEEASMIRRRDPDHVRSKIEQHHREFILPNEEDYLR
jgi:hypothetical protein